MKTSERGSELVKELEDIKFTAYPCAAGKWTIGRGHTDGVKEGDTISRPEAEVLFVEDIRQAEAIVNEAVKVPLTQNQFDSLVSFVFNVGKGQPGVRSGFVYLKNGEPSTMLKMLNQKFYRQAAAQFDKWVKGGEDKHVIAGLVRRRKMEKNLFLSNHKVVQDRIELIIDKPKCPICFQAQQTVEVDVEDMEFEIPAAGHILVFKDKGKRHKIFTSQRLFELDEIKPA